MALRRLTRAIADLAVMGAPILAALVVAVLTLVYWPGAIVGVVILIAIGWFCRRQIEKVQREHNG